MGVFHVPLPVAGQNRPQIARIMFRVMLVIPAFGDPKNVSILINL